MYRNYIFDFGNVLCVFDPVLFTRACVRDEAQVQQIYPVVFDRKYWNALDAGTIDHAGIKEAIRPRLPEGLYGSACQVLDKLVENLPPFPGMAQLVADLTATGGKLYLLSNISVEFTRDYQQVSWIRELFSLFDGLVFSGPLRLVKPDSAIFTYILDQFSLKPEESIFIDDNADNIATAAGMGIHTYRFDGDADALRRFLGL